MLADESVGIGHDLFVVFSAEFSVEIDLQHSAVRDFVNVGGGFHGWFPVQTGAGTGFQTAMRTESENTARRGTKGGVLRVPCLRSHAIRP